MYKRKTTGYFNLIMFIGIFAGCSFLICLNFFSPSRQAIQVVEEYYEYEQAGDYSNSWKFLHSSMKERFPKGVFIQDRVHVFMGHLGADTFEFSIDKDNKLTNWRMSNEGKALNTVYEILVTQYYKGKYGTFNFQQYVYVTEEKGEWVILWDFNK